MKHTYTPLIGSVCPDATVRHATEEHLEYTWAEVAPGNYVCIHEGEICNIQTRGFLNLVTPAPFYIVQIRCSCNDYSRCQPGEVCKHIYAFHRRTLLPEVI